MIYSKPSATKILIIDDEPINLDVLKELLDCEGYSSITCHHNPLDAIQSYKCEEYDLVILDLNMPIMSGFDVMDAFKDIQSRLPPPILVLTALGDKATKIQALTQGANDFLTKPFDHEETISRVNNLIHLHIAKKELKKTNDILEEKVQKRTQQLQEATMDAIYRLGLVADYRDTETSEHTKRVGTVSQKLGELLGLDKEYCTKLLHAAPMHDIGKIGIPDSILLKPGKLTPDEWKYMKRHTIIGEHILQDSPSDILELAREIALSHHEKWDGTGYPSQLKGEEIPLSGRIVIIADVFDALSSDRPYKKAWPKEKILGYMLEQKAIMFDPKVLDVFLHNIEFIGSDE